MVTVRTVVCATAPLIVTEPGMLQEGGLLATTGEIAQFRLTTPLKPPDGVSVIVEVLPDVAPDLTVIAVPERVKLGRVMVYVAVATDD